MIWLKFAECVALTFFCNADETWMTAPSAWSIWFTAAASVLNKEELNVGLHESGSSEVTCEEDLKDLTRYVQTLERMDQSCYVSNWKQGYLNHPT